MWTHLVTKWRVIERVQFVGDVFANEVPEHFIEERIWLQEVGEPLSRPTHKLTVLLCHDGHLFIKSDKKVTSHLFAMIVLSIKHKEEEVINTYEEMRRYTISVLRRNMIAQSFFSSFICIMCDL